MNKNNQCDCPLCRAYKTQQKDDGKVYRQTPSFILTEAETQLARIIARFHKLDARGRKTLVRMAESMPTGQVAG